MEKVNESFKFFAFISYNSKDTKWGKRLQYKLEHYRMPATLCGERNWKSRTPIRPVFFAPTDIQPGGLSDELKRRLAASQQLIVICSPNSAKSEWVGKEIEYFYSLGRAQNIHFFIVDGNPDINDTENGCFNPILKQLDLPEILGANIHEKNFKLPWLNKERAYVQLITKLLGVEFDTLWQRHKRLLKRKVVLLTLLVLLVAAAIFSVWNTNQLFEVKMCLSEVSLYNPNLPQMENAEVTIFLNNEQKQTTAPEFNENFIFNNIPAKYLDREVRMVVQAMSYQTLDTMVRLNNDVHLYLHRDDTFAKYFGQIFDKNGHAFPGVQVQILDLETVTDENGYYIIEIPIEKQNRVQNLLLSKAGHSDKVYEDMQPGKNNFVLY